MTSLTSTSCFHVAGVDSVPCETEKEKTEGGHNVLHQASTFHSIWPAYENGHIGHRSLKKK